MLGITQIMKKMVIKFFSLGHLSNGNAQSLNGQTIMQNHNTPDISRLMMQSSATHTEYQRKFWG